MRHMFPCTIYHDGGHTYNRVAVMSEKRGESLSVSLAILKTEVRGQPRVMCDISRSLQERLEVLFIISNGELKTAFLRRETRRLPCACPCARQRPRRACVNGLSYR